MPHGFDREHGGICFPLHEIASPFLAGSKKIRDRKVCLVGTIELNMLLYFRAVQIGRLRSSLLKVIWWSHSPTLRQYRHVLYRWLFRQLPIDPRHLSNDACPQFHHFLKTVLFRLAWVGSGSE